MYPACKLYHGFRWSSLLLLGGWGGGIETHGKNSICQYFRDPPNFTNHVLRGAHVLLRGAKLPVAPCSLHPGFAVDCLIFSVTHWSCTHKFMPEKHTGCAETHQKEHYCFYVLLC